MIAKSELIQNRRDLRLTFHEAWTRCLFVAELHIRVAATPGVSLFIWGYWLLFPRCWIRLLQKFIHAHVRSLNKKAENLKSFVKFKWKSKALHQIKQPHEAAEIPLTKSSDTVTPSSFKEQVVNMSTVLTWIRCPC